MTLEPKTNFPVAACERMSDFDANWCKSKVDPASIVPQGPFSDNLDDVIIHDVLYNNSLDSSGRAVAWRGVSCVAWLNSDWLMRYSNMQTLTAAVGSILHAQINSAAATSS